MQFLITTRPHGPLPPDRAHQIIESLGQWAARYQKSGHFKTIWSFAGKRGGGALVQVKSLEELDTIMTEFPLGAFSEVEIQPIVDLHPSLERAKDAIAAMAEQKR